MIRIDVIHPVLPSRVAEPRRIDRRSRSGCGPTDAVRPVGWEPGPEPHHHPGPVAVVHRRLGLHRGAHGRGQLGHDGQAETGPLAPAPRTRSEMKWRSKTWASWSAGMPGPSSTTQTAGRAARRCPPPPPTRRSAKDEAFSTRLATTWPSRSGSASTHRGGAGPTRGDQLQARAPRPGAEPFGHLADHLGRVDGWRSRENRSASSRARSSRSWTSRSSRRASALITVAAAAGSSVAPSTTASA